MTITVNVPNAWREEDVYALSPARAQDFARHFLELPFEWTGSMRADSATTSNATMRSPSMDERGNVGVGSAGRRPDSTPIREIGFLIAPP